MSHEITVTRSDLGSKLGNVVSASAPDGRSLAFARPTKMRRKGPFGAEYCWQIYAHGADGHSHLIDTVLASRMESALVGVARDVLAGGQ